MLDLEFNDLLDIKLIFLLNIFIINYFIFKELKT